MKRKRKNTGLDREVIIHDVTCRLWDITKTDGNLLSMLEATARVVFNVAETIRKTAEVQGVADDQIPQMDALLAEICVMCDGYKETIDSGESVQIFGFDANKKWRDSIERRGEN